MVDEKAYVHPAYTFQNYIAYKEMMRTENPTFIPTTYDNWVKWNEAMGSLNDSRENARNGENS